VIKDSLGHSRIQITEIYLDSFGSEELDEANKEFAINIALQRFYDFFKERLVINQKI
jgi:hypothetical protein